MDGTSTSRVGRLDAEATARFVGDVWDEEIVPRLIDYIRIPNKSPLFDPEWREHGYMDQAVELIASWCRAQDIPGMSLEVVRIEDRTPVILMEIPGEGDDTVLLYGHLDKQPEMVGWRSPLGPWEPVLEGDRLYGRGGADDGYAAFASLTAIRALQQAGGRHARCVVLIEACEESGSFDLPVYIDALAERIGEPSLVVCLDSGCGNYDQMWSTTSLRGVVTGDLIVELLTEGVHSGDASGIVPDSFRVLRSVLSRLEDPETGRILPDFLNADIPEARREQAALAARELADDVHSKFPWRSGVVPVEGSLDELVLNRTWRPALSITGADGLPSLDNAGNVCRPRTALKLSLRVPPSTDVDAASAGLKELLEADPPYGASVRFEPEQGGAGWDAPALAGWLEAAAEGASQAFFGKPCVYMGEGGSIPFMGMLGEKFPAAQFLITGVLGPHSNAHGPNEFLHIPTGKRLTCCVAQILADHLVRA